jgi:hypothetical protein
LRRIGDESWLGEIKEKADAENKEKGRTQTSRCWWTFSWTGARIATTTWWERGMMTSRMSLPGAMALVALCLLAACNGSDSARPALFSR